MPHHAQEPEVRGQTLRVRKLVQRFTVYAALAIILFFLITEHRAHFFGALPYLLLLACPLMHLFMHRGHSHGNKEDHQ